MTLILPTPPIRSPVVGADGRVSPLWAKWFATFSQIVGYSGPASNDDLTALTTIVSGLDSRLDAAESDILSQQSDISDLQTTDTALSARITSLEADVSTLLIHDITALLLSEIVDLKSRIEVLERVSTYP